MGDAGSYDHAKTYKTLYSHEQKTGQKYSICVVIPPNIGKKIRVMAGYQGLKMLFTVTRQSLVERYGQKIQPIKIQKLKLELIFLIA